MSNLQDVIQMELRTHSKERGCMIPRSNTSDKLEAPVATAPATGELESVVAEAAKAANVPVAFVGFVEKAGESVKAARGWNIALIPPAVSFAIRIANQT